jgi:ElaB/YqjD/DUF883 family membrane-anchored ribosome-binding protein
MNTEDIRNNGGDGVGAAVDTMEAAAQNMESAFSRGKEQLEELQEKAMEISKAACDNANKYVKENPWQAVGIAAAIGLVAGLVIRRR